MMKKIKKILSCLLIIAMFSTLLVGCDSKKNEQDQTTGENKVQENEVQITTKDYSAEVKDLPAETAKVYIALASQVETFAYAPTDKYLSSNYEIEIKEIGSAVENGKYFEGLKLAVSAGITNGYINLATNVLKNNDEIFNLSFGATDKCLLLSSSLLNNAKYKVELSRIPNEFNGSEFQKFLLGLQIPVDSIPTIAATIEALLPQLTNPDTIESTLALLTGSLAEQPETISPESINKLFEDLKKAVKISNTEKVEEKKDETIYKLTFTKDAAQLILNSVYENIITPLDPSTKAPTIMDYEEVSLLVGITANGALSSLEINDEESGGKLSLTFNASKIVISFKESSEANSDEFHVVLSSKISSDTYVFAIEELKVISEGEVVINVNALFSFSTAPITVPNVADYTDLIDIDSAKLFEIYQNVATNLVLLMQKLGINLGM